MIQSCSLCGSVGNVWGIADAKSDCRGCPLEWETQNLLGGLAMKDVGRLIWVVSNGDCIDSSVETLPHSHPGQISRQSSEDEQPLRAGDQRWCQWMSLLWRFQRASYQWQLRKQGIIISGAAGGGMAGASHRFIYMKNKVFRGFK